MPKRNLDDVATDGQSNCVESSPSSDRRILRAAKKMAAGCSGKSDMDSTNLQDGNKAIVDTSESRVLTCVKGGEDITKDHTSKKGSISGVAGDINNHNNVETGATKRAKSEGNRGQSQNCPQSLSNGVIDDSSHVTSSSSSELDSVTSETEMTSVSASNCQQDTDNDGGGVSDIDKNQKKGIETKAVPRSILRKVSKYGPSLGSYSHVSSNGSSPGDGNTSKSACVPSDRASSGAIHTLRTLESSAVTVVSRGRAVSENSSQIGNEAATSKSCDQRESVESIIESLSDKEIENDSVFDSSNDTITDPSVSPRQQPSPPQNSPKSSGGEKSPEINRVNQSPTSVHAKDESPPDLEPPRKKKKAVKFSEVNVYYFARKQGFICVPSQGGSTLGMSESHLKEEKLTVYQHAKLQREVHKHILLEQHQQGKIHIPSPKLQQLQKSLPPTPPSSPHTRSISPNPTTSTSSQNSEEVEAEAMEVKEASEEPPEASEGEEDEARFSSDEESEDDLQVDEYYFLQPVPTRQRRMMLRLAGVKKIDAVEKDLCKDIRSSREVCGCDCNGVCDPETCICSLAGIKCQVDRPAFPCGCSKEGCKNPEGRIEFNPIRVRTHFIHTLMRLENERKMEQRKRALAAAKRRRHLRFLDDGGTVPVEAGKVSSTAAKGANTESPVGQNNTAEESEGEMDLSEFNSNEFGSCRDCQNSEVNHFLMRQRQHQQQANQHQARVQLTGVNAYAADSQSDPPSCMGTGGVQQAYMATVEDNHAVTADQSLQIPTAGNRPDATDGNPSPGQVFGSGEEYLTDATVAATTDMFGFVQEEASYSESSEECSSVGSNPETESTSVLQSQGFLGNPQSFPQSKTLTASQRYEQQSLGVMPANNQQIQGNMGNVLGHQAPSKAQSVVGMNQLGSAPAPPLYNIPVSSSSGVYSQTTNPILHQPCTAAAEQKYIELNSNASSFKLEPISEILNPIRFPGYPSGNWHGNQSATASSVSEGYTPYPPLLHGSKPYNSPQVQGGSGDFNTLSTAAVASMQPSHVTQINPHHPMAEASYQPQVSSTVDSTRITPDLQTAYKEVAPEFTPLQELTVPASETLFQSSELSSTYASETKGEGQNHVTSTSSGQVAADEEATPTKCYHELTKSTCHSASEAVYAAAAVSSQDPGSAPTSSTNLLTQESHRKPQACESLLSAMSPVQSNPSPPAATTESSIQVLDALVSSVTMSVTEQHQRVDLASSSVTMVTSSNGAANGVVSKENVASVSAGSEAENTVDEKAENGSTTDDSEDSGLGSMAEEASSTQDFGEIIKTSIVETVSA